MNMSDLGQVDDVDVTTPSPARMYDYYLTMETSPGEREGHMANERLRTALARNRWTVTGFADALTVDHKTVERWISKDRMPHWLIRTSIACQLSVRPYSICDASRMVRYSRRTSNASNEYGLTVGRSTPKDDLHMTRVDYLNDPNAPKANSIVPAVSAIVTDDESRILMILRTDNGYWSIPGGGLKPGETPRQATAREVKEETGIDCQVTGIVEIYSNPNHVAAYDDGEVRQEFSICFTTRKLGGTPTTSDESAKVRFVPPADIEDYNIHPSIFLRICHYLESRAEPYIS